MGPAAPELRIAVARRDERDMLLGLWLDLVEHHRRLDPDYPALRGLRVSLAAELDRVLQSRSGRAWLASFGAEPVGFTLAEIELAQGGAAGGNCWIHELYVAPEFRRRGVGASLVAGAEAFFRERAGGRRLVRVESSNPEALRFWSRVGFREQARILERADLPGG